MKFVLIVATSAALMIPASGAMASDPDVGCGVGTQIMAGSEGRVSKIAASFLNGLLFQSVSITFGLLNCTNVDGPVVGQNAEAQLKHYASQNFDRLAEDMAMGHGEHLDVVAFLLAVAPEDREHFRATTQAHFEELFPHDRVTVGEMLDNLHQVMASDERLAGYSPS